MTATLRQAVKDRGESLYRISKETGINDAALGRFVNGKQSLRLDMADRLALYLELELRKAR